MESEDAAHLGAVVVDDWKAIGDGDGDMEDAGVECGTGSHSDGGTDDETTSSVR
jgi:hypothetical protein